MAKKIPVYTLRAQSNAIRGIRPRTVQTARSTTSIPRDGIVVRVTEEEFVRRLVVDGNRFEASRKLTS